MEAKLSNALAFKQLFQVVTGIVDVWITLTRGGVSGFLAFASFEGVFQTPEQQGVYPRLRVGSISDFI